MGSAVEDDVPVRWTTVHSRYHVSGFIAGEWELIEAVETKAAAFRLARRSIGPRHYERTSVFDSMAHRGRTSRWEFGPEASQ